MKRTLLFILFFLPMLSLAVSASEKIDGIYYNLDTDTKTATVVFHVRYYYSGDVVIPSTVTHEGVDYSVTRIEGAAFRGSADLTSLTIPHSVTSIGDGIFDGCTSLTSINIEEGNPVFDSRENCNAIIETASNTLIVGCKGSTIPNGVTSIGKNAFLGCTALTSFNIPNHVVTIGESAFEGCSGLTSINIPNSVTTFGYEAFYGCSNLTKVELNNNALVSKNNSSSTPTPITRIFGIQVEEYIIGKDVMSIGNYAFLDNYNLTSVIISNGVVKIGEGAFEHCIGLTSITIPNSITSIEERAFNDCFHLTDMYCYAEEVPELGYNVFYNSNGYATLHVPAGSLETYKAAGQWKDFKSIVALTDDDPKPTGIMNVNSNVMTVERYYTLDGKYTTTPHRGINIIRMSDGTTKKIVIK